MNDTRQKLATLRRSNIPAVVVSYYSRWRTNQWPFVFWEWSHVVKEIRLLAKARFCHTRVHIMLHHAKCGLYLRYVSCRTRHLKWLEIVNNSALNIRIAPHKMWASRTLCVSCRMRRLKWLEILNSSELNIRILKIKECKCGRCPLTWLLGKESATLNNCAQN